MLILFSRKNDEHNKPVLWKAPRAVTMTTWLRKAGCATSRVKFTLGYK